MMAVARGHSAVMAQRTEPPDSLDFFPTPPWATRALCQHLNRWGATADETAWDPACGEGHMVRPLQECFRAVHGSDVHDYGCPEQGRVTDFLVTWDRAPAIESAGVDWIITNPPFRLAEEFALTAMAEARTGVALFVRTAFLESGGRWERLFKPHPPEWILQFSERVILAKGVCRDPDVAYWDAEAGKMRKPSTATSYCWIIWLSGRRIPAPGKEYDPTHFPAFVWLPPCRKTLTKPRDYAEVA